MKAGKQFWLGLALTVVGLIGVVTMVMVEGELGGIPILIAVSGLILIALSKRR
ncbi:MAG: hypothetical protein AAGJ52_08530 [Pseudomonadota bacterium]